MSVSSIYMTLTKKIRMEAFTEFKWDNGLLYDYSSNEFPTKLHAWTNEGTVDLGYDQSTYYGYVYKGVAVLYLEGRSYQLLPGMFFAVPGGLKATVHSGCGILIERKGYHGVFSLGGPIEEKGRLRYIDGCTDSLLIPPVKVGDPCLNALYFPPGIDQTMHTHPSMRVGVVASGSGVCVTPEGEISLTPGTLFIIHQDGLHKFRTTEESMTVIAYHPDSDHGPQDEDHPMINRTMVEGQSAKNLTHLHTS